MINIERVDKKHEPRFDEIQQDWRTWARKNGYKGKKAISVKQNDMNISLEILENPKQEDVYLLYIPPIPKTVGGETLYIITNQEQLNFMVDAAKKMVAAAIVMTQEKLEIRRIRLN